MTNQLSGFQRFLLVKQWRKYYMEEYPDKEQYIQAVCKAKGIQYTKPSVKTREISIKVFYIDEGASMFPVKEK